MNQRLQSIDYQFFKALFFKITLKYGLILRGPSCVQLSDV